MTTTREYLWPLSRARRRSRQRQGRSTDSRRAARPRRGFRHRRAAARLSPAYRRSSARALWDRRDRMRRRLRLAELFLGQPRPPSADVQDGRGDAKCNELRHQPSHGRTPLSNFMGSGPPGHAHACQMPGMGCRQNGQVESLRMSIWLAVKPTRSTSILRHCGQ